MVRRETKSIRYPILVLLAVLSMCWLSPPCVRLRNATTETTGFSVGPSRSTSGVISNLRTQEAAAVVPPKVVEPHVWQATLPADVTSVALSANGSTIVVTGSSSGTSYVSVFNNTSGTPEWTYAWNQAVDGEPYYPSISDDGMYFVVSIRNAPTARLFLFNRTSSTPMWIATIGNYFNAKISGDGQYIAAASANGYLRLFQRSSSTPLWTYTTALQLLEVDISHNGSLIVTGSTTDWAQNYVYLFGSASNSPLRTYPLTPNANCYSVEMTPNTGYIIAGEYQLSGPSKAFYFHSSSSLPMWNYSAPGDVDCAAISEDGSRVVLGLTKSNPSDSEGVFVLNGANGHELWNYTASAAGEISSDRNGDYVITGPGHVSSYGVYLFHTSSGIPEWTCEVSQRYVAISDTGGYFLVAWGNQVRLYRNLVPPSQPVLMDLGETDEDGVVDLQWSDSLDPDGSVAYYELQMDSDTGFDPPSEAWYPVTSEKLIEHLTNGSYFFRVRAWDIDDQPSEWSNVESITVTITNHPPSTPTLFDPGDTDPDGNVTVDWTDATDSDGSVIGYHLQMDDNESFTSPDQNWYPPSSIYFVQGLSNGTYWFRVRAQDNGLAWGSWSNVQNITVEITNSPPSAPSLFDPGDVDVDGSFWVDWSNSTDSDGFVAFYQLQMDTEAAFISPDITWYPSDSIQWISGLMDGVYFFRVRTRDDFGTFSPWSNSENITVQIPNQPPTTPVLYDPGDFDEDGSFAIDWSTSTDPDGIVVSYLLEMDDDSGFGSIEQSWSLTTSSHVVTGLAEGLWYFRVCARDNEGANSTWSNTESILVDIQLIDMVGPTMANIQLSPTEPMTGQTVHLFVAVNDSSGIWNVTLYYRVNAGSWLSVAMSSVTSGIFAATFPALAEGSNVEYYVRAYDASPQCNAAQTAMASFTIKAPTGPTTPLFGADPLLVVGYALSGLAVGLATLALVLFTVNAREKKLSR